MACITKMASLSSGHIQLFLSKKRGILLLLILLLCDNVLFAKEEILKLDKKIIYTGAVEKKTPNGLGKLYIKLTNDKFPLVITGQYHGNTIFNGTYGNIFRFKYSTWSSKEERFANVFHFDSLKYSVDKKEHFLHMEAYGVRFDNSEKMVYPNKLVINYKYNKNKKIWEVTISPYTIDIEGAKKGFTYRLKSTCESGDRIKSSYNGDEFEPIYFPHRYPDKDISDLISLNYDKGASVSINGNHFVAKWGTSTLRGEYTEYGIKNGALSLNNATISNAQFVQDGEDWKGEVHYKDGSRFIGEVHLLVDLKQFGTNILDPRVHKNHFSYYSGEYYTPDNFFVRYNNNTGADNDDVLSCALKAYKVQSPGYSEAPYVTHRLADNRVVEDNRETLSTFVNLGRNSKGYGEKDLKNLFSDNYYYKWTNDFTYDEVKEVITFKGHAQETFAIPDSKEFYVAMDDHLCFSYPKSRISLHHGKNYFDQPRSVPTLETVKIPKEDYKKIQDKKCELVWVFKIEEFSNYRLFGKTNKLLIVDPTNNKVLLDLSESLKPVNSTFKKETREVYKKKTYHSKGRVENCGICLGTGMGWQGGICPFCGGKGWYIEHEW